VVVSEQIVDYEIGKVTPNGFTPRGSVYPCDASLLNGIRNFKRDSWKGYIRTNRPYGKNQLSSHIGVYLAGNKVIADEETAGALKSIWARASAIEMEASGIAALL
jgi:nucleoside phosphorylase